MNSINIITKADVERIVELALDRKAKTIAREIMCELERRVPEPGSKVLKDEDPVELLSLSTRAINILTKHHIYTIGDLSATKENQLRRLRDCGRLTMLELETRLARFGRTFAPE